ncbi:hypothetical protein D3C79_965780 [compost metagenome]
MPTPHNTAAETSMHWVFLLGLPSMQPTIPNAAPPAHACHPDLLKNSADLLLARRGSTDASLSGKTDIGADP